ncbi:hypothetical protein PGTUg99_012160 [Puccinia graminis f. sp. tritici]|uniref:Transmembrane protein n=1 Tax=Puccinia graminis f. sp. tritici TaxID=56615 RepID=A0A5B0R7X3_PUCGR|nr:hypothetical protein PGTUg99_012160 [Puccinia graminis f. sp. tritici]
MSQTIAPTLSQKVSSNSLQATLKIKDTMYIPLVFLLGSLMLFQITTVSAFPVEALASNGFHVDCANDPNQCCPACKPH